MECKHKETKDEYDENLGCFHKVDKCTLNRRQCQGSDGVCSLFDAKEEAAKPEEKPAQEEAEEPEKKEEAKPEDKAETKTEPAE